MANNNSSPVPFKKRNLKDIELSNNNWQQELFTSELFQNTPDEFFKPLGSL
jgi:hypothetical protein